MSLMIQLKLQVVIGIKFDDSTCKLINSFYVMNFFFSAGLAGLLPVLHTKVPQIPDAILRNGKKADTKYLIDQQRLEV
jgi:hypothetical protein